jgi:two-component system heavy metal sensor histidine kinase CusS
MASSFIVVLATTAIQFWTYQHRVRALNDDLLQNRIQDVSRAIAQRPYDSLALSEEMVWGGAAATGARIWLRVTDAQGLLGETPGMAELMPRSWFEGGPTVVKAGRTYILKDRFDGRIRIQAGMDTTETEQMLVSYLHELLVTLGGALVIAALLGGWAAYRGLKPIRDIVAAAERISAYPLKGRLEPGRVPRELQHLVQALNAMLDRINLAFQRLTQFSSDLAHEFRTPISILVGEAETALAKERTPEEYRQVLESSLEEYGRLSRLTSRMLFLARTENPQSAIAMGPVPMDDLAREVVDFFEAPAAEKQVILTRSVRGSVRGDRDMLRQALGNLLSNALEATPPGGTIAIKGGAQGGRWVMTVADNGRGIPARDLPHVLDRFYRGDDPMGAAAPAQAAAARPARGPGTGLGLAIVQSITRLHGGEVAIASEEGVGTTVTLTFPAPVEDQPSAAGGFTGR